MLKKLFEKIEAFFNSRILVITLVFIGLFTVLVVKILSIQVKPTTVDGKTVEEVKIYKLRDIKATRGNIYDVNGKLLAYNVMSYSVIMEDSGLLVGNTAKNAMIYKLVKILEAHDTELEISFPIVLDENGKLQFTLTGNSLLRFKKNAYGRKSVNDLTEEELAAGPDEVYDFLKNGAQRAVMFQISDEYPIEDILKIMAIRYTIFSNIAGTQFTIASDIDTELAVAIFENGAELPGVTVQQSLSRVYNESVYMAHILGYTGAINTEEKEDLNVELIQRYGLTTEQQEQVEGVSVLYNTSDVIGKTGIEKSMQEILAGTKGTNILTVNSAGKILTSTTNTDPVAGNDVYLSIDTDLQKACYYILERDLAGILLSKLTPKLDYGKKGTDAKKILIPIYEVYYALIDNGIIDIDHFSEDGATTVEMRVLLTYDNYRQNLISNLNLILGVNSEILNSQTSEEQQDYLEFIYSKVKEYGYLPLENIDTTDATYKSYVAGEISLSALFKYALTKNWIDTSSFSDANDYYSISELYELFLNKLMTQLQNDNDFKEKIYRTLIFNNTISGRDICLLLYDQGVLEYNETKYNRLVNGYTSAYNFMYDAIYNLEITPGQLGLTPCSGSIVVTDVRTGSVKALVSYPSYDNNMLANKIDYDYYSSLLELNSYPLINRPALQTTTTGSTFKPLSALMGMAEGVITPWSKINDKGIFESVVPSPRCWIYPWNHGSINVTDAIMHSCNYFFFEVGYRLMNNGDGTYSDSTGIKAIRKYATLFGFGERSGIEISEAAPQISDTDAVRTAIGYGHSFAPVQISRYISAIANKGTVFNYTLLDSIRSSDGTVIEKQEPSVLNNLTNYFSYDQWNAVRSGMWKVVNTSVDSFDTLYKSLSVQVAGKTGTAQVSDSIPSHVLFVSFAPYENAEISVTVVVPNGFQSANAAYIAREVYGYYFDGQDAEELLSGNVHASNATNITVSD